MKEKTIIEIIDSVLPSGRSVPVFTSDAEVLTLQGGEYLFSTDEFSEEDLFSDENLFNLGWNIAAGTISDCLACGGLPLYYAHSLTVKDTWTESDIRQFARGSASVLTTLSVGFIGGDCGKADRWRCNGTVIGKTGTRRVSRIGAVPGDAIYLTGRVGSGNLEAARNLFSSELRKAPFANLFPFRIPLRQKESTIIGTFASSCIDTSDGVHAAITAIADLNTCGYILDTIPYNRIGRAAARLLRLPPLVMVLGGCGEYELLCTVPSEREKEFLDAVKKEGLQLFRIGAITPTGEKIKVHRTLIDMSSFRIDPRDFVSPRAYLKEMTEWVENRS